MALVKWRPMRDLLDFRNEIDRLFEDFFTDEFPVRFRSEMDSWWNPRADVVETDDEIVVNVELPGVKKDDVKISIQDNILHIRGEKKQEKEDKNKNFHRIERSYGAFQRSFELPVAVDAKKVKASYKDGVLTVKLPKTEEAKVKEIPIAIE